MTQTKSLINTVNIKKSILTIKLCTNNIYGAYIINIYAASTEGFLFENTTTHTKIHQRLCRALEGPCVNDM